MLTAVLLIVGYVCGSMPTGVWLGRWVGVDVQQSGSGNIGATNVARLAGFRPGLLTLCGDVAKGLIPVVAARALLADGWQTALVGLAAFFGHLFPIFLRFSGGKGVATGFGVFLALAPAAALVSFLVFAAIGVWTGYASLASIVAAGSLPLAVVTLGYPRADAVTALVIGASIVAQHRENLLRLREGREPKFRIRRTQSSSRSAQNGGAA
jgi:acyl phosphate:glycerol-3-phosphate acyltransferase